MSRLLLPLGLVLMLCSLAAADERQLAHMVFFTLADDTPQNRQKLVAACHEHLSGHEGAVYFSAGAVADELRREVNDRGFGVALHIVFANKQVHDTYQTHPRHLKFIEQNKALWSKVRVFDSYVTGAGSAGVGSLLSNKVTFEFQQLSLELACRGLEDAFAKAHPTAGLKISVVGGDLQREGITRNQQIRNVRLRDKPLSEALTELVKLANPIQNVKSLADPDQKLIWVVAPDNKSILITTRSGAELRIYELPKVFRAK